MKPREGNAAGATAVPALPRMKAGPVALAAVLAWGAARAAVGAVSAEAARLESSRGSRAPALRQVHHPTKERPGIMRRCAQTADHSDARPSPTWP